MLREDYRQKAFNAVMSIPEGGIYEDIYPVVTPHGEVWLHSFMDIKEVARDGHIVALGMLQQIKGFKDDAALKTEESPVVLKTALKDNMENISNRMGHLMARVNSIIGSLNNFLRSKNMDEGVKVVLDKILHDFNAQRVAIFEYDKKEDCHNCICEVVADGVKPYKQNMQNEKINLLKLCGGSSREADNEPIILERPYSIDEIEPHIREFLKKSGVETLILVPLKTATRTIGFMGLSITSLLQEWLGEDLQWLYTLGKILSICLDLTRTRKRAVRDHAFLENTYQYMPLGYSRFALLYDEQEALVGYEVLDYNSQLMRITGVLEDRILGRHILSGVNLEKFKSIVDVVKQNGYSEGDECYAASGKTCRIITFSPQKDILVVLFHDITERIKATREIMDKEVFIRNIFDNLPVGVEVYDTEGRLKDMNVKDMEIFGVESKADCKDFKLFESRNIPDDVKKKIKSQDKVEFDTEYHFNTIENTYRPKYKKEMLYLNCRTCKLYDIDNNLNGYIHLSIDTTEAVMAKMRAGSFEKLFSHISDYAKLGYAKYNLLNGDGFVVKQWLKNIGEREDVKLIDVINANTCHIHHEDRKPMGQMLRKILNGEIKQDEREIRIVSSGDENDERNWRWIHIFLVVDKYAPEDGVIEVVSVNYDVDELRKTQASLIEARDKAQSADRLKSAFLASMSHEIRTPLNAIVGFSGLLVETDDKDECEEYNKIIESNNELLLQIISDILDFAKIEAGTFDFNIDEVDVPTMCRDVIATTKSKVMPGVELVLEHIGEDYKIKSDGSRLRQVLINFISNAAKFTDNGSITVGVEKIDSSHLRFYVKDTGIGIAPDKIDTVFDRFVKLNTFSQGTGLGLSICKSIIDQLGGKIGVDSQVGKGSTFWFILKI